MSQSKRLARRMLSVVLRGAVLGLSLSAFFPTQSVVAGCVCDDGGSGSYKCPSGAASSCWAGTEKCDVTCS
jgi:hypothetical protein